MLSINSRFVAQSLLSVIDLKLSLTYAGRIPQDIPLVVISNHRSFLDAPILIKTLPQPLRIACHHYMGQTPVVREAINSLGCFPLAATHKRQKHFFQQANELLAARQWVGLFPEGTEPMIEPTDPQQLKEFHRGFAHLAWRSSLAKAVLPVAIASIDETIYPTIPIQWLQRFDAEEPFFNRQGLHPMVVYHRVKVLIGRPYWIGESQKQEYKGKQAKKLAIHLTEYCQEEIEQLLQEGCY